MVTATPEYSSRTRKARIEELQAAHTSGKPAQFDAVIVGGGIVGAGLARELTLRGKSVMLAEQNDFASGTSSKSSKLIHGGLRYLEMMDFGLVFESLSERHWLLKSQPHLVKPLAFNLPLYDKKNAPPGMRPSWMLSLGLWLYDGLSLFRSPFFHGRHTPEQSQKIFPGLKSEGLKNTLYYADAMMLDDEMVLECISDSIKRGTTALNYLKVQNVSTRGSNGLYSIQVSDNRSKNSGDIFNVTAREVIVCVGPWTEKFGKFVPEGAGRKLKPSRGTHIIVDYQKLPIKECLVMYSGDGRIVFAIPRLDLGAGAEKVIIGTTDAHEDRDPANVHATKEDVTYILKVLAGYFPKLNITAADILTSYAGVRPLIDEGSHQVEAKTSREHEIWRNPAGIVFMAGGKYTTFRRISQEIADFAFPNSMAKESDKNPLSDPQEYAARFTGEKLWGRYTEGFLRWKIRHQSPCTLTDIVYRRLPLWMQGSSMPKTVIDRVSVIAQEELGLTSDEIQAQVTELYDHLREDRSAFSE